MKNFNYIQAFFFFYLILGLANNTVIWSQKIDVDSLLHVAISEAKEEKNYDSALKKSHLGIKLSPNYLDFYLLAGRIHDSKKNQDSTLYYYQYVIDRNPAYKDAFSFMINELIEEKNLSEAEKIVDRAIAAHPGEKDFKHKKMLLYELQGENKKAKAYLKELQTMYPTDKHLKMHQYIRNNEFHSDRIGINYDLTTFNREGYGPWHMGSLQYVKQRSWGAVIGRISYANRYANGESLIDGLQYEVEAYINSGKKSYSFLSASYSSDPVFPNVRLGYSFYHNFKKGWEVDLGTRYINNDDGNLYSAVVGMGKYIGSFWINLRSFIQFDNNEAYAAYTLTSRYYFNTRFDYLTLIMGYGTSPDERYTLGQIEQRVIFDSFRIGGGIYHLFGRHYVTGAQINFNKQEYAPNKTQLETNISLQLQYQF